jgi:uncharacterized protein YkwD
VPQRRHIPPLITVLVLLATVAPSAEARASTCDHVDSEPAEVGRAVVERATRCQINVVRASHGLRPLKAHPRLANAARGHSADMVRNRYFAHTSLGGADFVHRIRGSGYLGATRGWKVGETLAWGSGGFATAGSIVDEWMHSPPHRHVILTPGYREIGVGVVLGAPRRGASSPAATYTADFGARP